MDAFNLKSQLFKAPPALCMNPLDSDSQNLLKPLLSTKAVPHTSSVTRPSALVVGTGTLEPLGRHCPRASDSTGPRCSTTSVSGN
ncbi:unnamed protein product [Protopolystoma xenopodis]|uniref:Uncharacterized protein n=1 Tax=Protopolystoma xenopodis TaxID=117903 RepID=A0A3S4ZZX0_9PLAT|nr:unnamed protein product [Protopolystoma xenopodis]